MRIFYIFVFGLAALHSAQQVSAQQWEAGASLAATGFMGDINPVNPFYFRSGGASVRGQHNFNPTWGLQASFSFLHLSATDLDSSDPYRRLRGRSMRNNVFEFAIKGHFNFFKFIPGEDRYKYTPYAFVGLAGIMHEPYTKVGDTRFRLERLEFQMEDMEQQLQTTAVSIPFGVGFKQNVSGPWSMGVELGYRWAMTDHLDNIYGHYPFTTTVPPYLREELHETQQHSGNSLWQDMAFPGGNYDGYQGRVIGNRGTFDGYMTFEVTLTYTIISQKCSWWGRD